MNVRGTSTLLDALGECGVEVVVQASTRNVFGQREDAIVPLSESADRRPVDRRSGPRLQSLAQYERYLGAHLRGVWTEGTAGYDPPHPY